MRWRFYLIDRYNTKTLIEEPIGWDAFFLKIKRHAERHGTFRELQANQFQFTGRGMELLKAEYEQYGIRSNFVMLIEGKCGKGYEELYRGQVAFDNYQYSCGLPCSVTVDLDQLGPLVKLINRFDQQVDLEKATAFDDTTALAAYGALSRKITLPSKSILVKSAAGLNDPVAGINLTDSIQWGANVVSAQQDQMYLTIIPAFTNVISTSLSNTTFFDELSLISGGYANMPPAGMTPLLDLQPFSTLPCINSEMPFMLHFKGAVHQTQSGSIPATSFGSLYVYKLPKGADETKPASYISYFNQRIWSLTGSGSQAFDVQQALSITINPGDKLFYNIFLSATPNRISDFRIDQDVECSIELSTISKCDPTPAKLYLLNETTSRVIESITDNGLKLSSSYLGRTDSEPYSFPTNGCGSLRGLTTGLHIRNAKLSDGTDPKLFLSMKDIFESLSAIDNIGIGIEGEDKLVLENWKYFYQNQVVFTCRGIDKLDKTLQASEHYSIFKCGYEKWEAEDFNGLDEFLTKREYHTALSEVQNTLEKVSKFIASGYAIEVTRRKQNDTKDWRYDNDAFVVCLTNKRAFSVTFSNAGNVIYIAASLFFEVGDQVEISGTRFNNGTYSVTGIGGFILEIISVDKPLVDETAVATFENLSRPQYGVETGNILNAQNILDPDTVYNFRISPARNALRWFDRVAACYRHITATDSLLFSKGDGNFLAEGELKDGCRLEAGLLKENEAISLSKYTDAIDGTPILMPERVKYKFPLSMEEYKLIKNNSYGLIEYISDCERGFGWIDELEYSPEEGSAKFSLIPSAGIAPVVVLPPPDEPEVPEDPENPDNPPPPSPTRIYVSNQTDFGTSFTIRIDGLAFGSGYVEGKTTVSLDCDPLTNATVEIRYPDIVPEAVQLYVTAPPLAPVNSNTSHQAVFENVTFQTDMMFIIK